MIVAATISTPKVDWLALSPVLALLVASCLCLLSSVLVPRAAVRGVVGLYAIAGFVASGVLAGALYERSPEAKLLIAESMTRDRIAALTQIILAVVGVAATLVALNDRRRSNVG
ncbi:MAG: hypothetical protein FJW96_07380, partial [Actinobacteria bacterium]|nr:hypothetical protein [Actinomycetota bacterium]